MRRGLGQLVLGLVLSLPAYAGTTKTCATQLLQKTKAKISTQELLTLVAENSARQDPEFIQYLVVLMYIESRFNALAVSSAGAVGLMQLTKIAMEDIKEDFVIDKLFLPSYNIKVGTKFLQLLLERNKGNWPLALIAYNGGQFWANRFRKGKSIPAETVSYLANIFYLKETYCQQEMT